jgi:hypothetical protein
MVVPIMLAKSTWRGVLAGAPVITWLLLIATPNIDWLGSGERRLAWFSALTGHTL